jgi:hypothetical protein
LETSPKTSSSGSSIRVNKAEISLVVSMVVISAQYLIWY